MTGLMGAMDNVNSAGSTYTILGDGRTLAVFEIEANQPSRPFNLDVTGMNQIEIRIGNPRFGVANLVLSGQGTVRNARPQPVTSQLATQLGRSAELPARTTQHLQNVLGRDIEPFRLTSMAEFTPGQPGMMMGAEYTSGFASTGWNASVFFNLDGRYASMTGLKGAMDNVNSDSSTFTILGDGRTIETFNVEANQPASQFNVNVSGISQIEIRISHPRFGLANVALATQGVAQTAFNPPLGIFNSAVTLGKEIEAFRLNSMTSFTPGQPGMIMGAEYEFGFASTGWNASAFFNLDGRYVSMAGLLGAMDNVNTASSTITILGDGRTLEIIEVEANQPARHFALGVIGISQLEIRIGNPRFGVANINLVSQGTARTEFNTPLGTFGSSVTLGNEIVAFRLSSMNAFTPGQPGRMMGAEHIHGFASTGWNASAFFNLDGRYTSMTCLLGAMDNVNTADSTFTILGDGRILETIEIQRHDPARQFTVNVAGVRQLEIRISNPRYGVANITLR